MRVILQEAREARYEVGRSPSKRTQLSTVSLLREETREDGHHFRHSLFLRRRTAGALLEDGHHFVAPVPSLRRLVGPGDEVPAHLQQQDPCKRFMLFTHLCYFSGSKLFQKVKTNLNARSSNSLDAA